MSVLTAQAGRLQGARPRKRPPALIWAPSVVVAAAAILPLIYLIARVAEGGWEDVSETVFDGDTLAVLARSVALAAIVTGAAVDL